MAQRLGGTCALWVITTSVMLFSHVTISVDPVFDEALVLVALKENMNDPLGHLADWVISVNGTSGSPCFWTGVGCGNPSSDVVSLNLSSMNLTGTVSSELGNFKNLVNVSLDCNNFTGELPAEIVTLSHLQYFNVSTNSFSGHLPPGFSKLQMLKVCASSKDRLILFQTMEYLYPRWDSSILPLLFFLAIPIPIQPLSNFETMVMFSSGPGLL